MLNKHLEWTSNTTGNGHGRHSVLYSIHIYTIYILRVYAAFASIIKYTSSPTNNMMHGETHSVWLAKIIMCSIIDIQREQYIYTHNTRIAYVENNQLIAGMNVVLTKNIIY